MNLRQHNAENEQAIVQLFESVFTASEGESEGALISSLAAELFRTSAKHDLFNFVADEDGQIVGSAFFTRLNFEDGSDAFILSPVAVHRERQGKGLGQALIGHGLRDLKTRGVSAVLTYGDPAFYSKVGFRQITPATVRPPFPLSQPEGWLGQSLNNEPIEALSGSFKCVDALNEPGYW